MSNIPTKWIPPLIQDPSTVNPNPNPVRFEDIPGSKYTLTYKTNYTVEPGSFVKDVNGIRTPDVSSAITTIRPTNFGVIPLITIIPDQSTPNINDILYSFPVNNNCFDVIPLEKIYYVHPQPASNSINSADYETTRREAILPYKNVLIIKGIYFPNGSYYPESTKITIPLRIQQARYTNADSSKTYTEKVIDLNITLNKASTNIRLRPLISQTVSPFDTAITNNGITTTGRTPNTF
jgi:hypothetical protein